MCGARGAGGLVYVATFSDSRTIYAAGATGKAAPTATITGSNTGLSQPEGIAFDAAGDLYVANVSNNSITVYAAGTTGNATPTAPIAADNTGVGGPAGHAPHAAGQSERPHHRHRH